MMDRKKLFQGTESLLQCLRIKPANLLWHYTDTQGLEGIVRNRTIRLSHPSFLNDPSELQYANSMYDEMLEDICVNSQDPLVQEFVNGFQDYKKNYQKQDQEDEYFFVVFVASFCGDPDRLDLWRQYGDDGQGFALGFRMEQLRDAVERQVEEMQISGWVHILRVLYSEDKQREYTRRILDFWIDEFKKNRESLRDKEDDLVDVYMIEVYSPLRTALGAIAPFFKHPCYENENENRLALNSTYIDPGKMAFQARRGYFKPYIDFNIEDDKNGIKDDGNDAFPLDTVMIGPTTPPMWSERSLRMFLANQRLKNAKLKRSDLPYRRP